MLLFVLKTNPSCLCCMCQLLRYKLGAPAKAGRWAGQPLASGFVSSHHSHSAAETEPLCHLHHRRPQRLAQCSARPGSGRDAKRCSLCFTLLNERAKNEASQSHKYFGIFFPLISLPLIGKFKSHSFGNRNLGKKRQCK